MYELSAPPNNSYDVVASSMAYFCPIQSLNMIFELHTSLVDYIVRRLAVPCTNTVTGSRFPRCGALG
jgi:hypothetical protein